MCVCARAHVCLFVCILTCWSFITPSTDSLSLIVYKPGVGDVTKCEHCLVQLLIGIQPRL